MAKKQFDLAAAISGIVSDLDTNAVDVRMIPLVEANINNLASACASNDKGT